jgi:exonuclease-1
MYRKRQDKLSKGYQHRLEGDRDKAMQRFAEAIDVTPQMANYVLLGLRGRGVECIVAPYEADAQLAYLSKIAYVDVVITEDSDLLAFGAKRVLYKLSKDGDGEEYALEDVPLCMELNFKDWDSNMFLTWCILTGCDYLE